MADTMERAYNWDDTIQNDNTFEVVPAGDYDFEITAFERARHEPKEGGKLPPCNKAVISVKVFNGKNSITIKHNLFLHSRCEGMLCEFFTAIGQRQHGEQLKMNWQKVVGSRGRCKVGIRTYTGNDNNEYVNNEIKRFYEPAEKQAPQAAYTPGNF